LSKLLKLKEWLTVEEAARHLGDIASEPVSEADILRLALDGHLTLSVRFVNGACANVGPEVPVEDVEQFDVPMIKLDPDDEEALTRMLRVIRGFDLGNGRRANLSQEVVSIEGLWDLTMLGAEVHDIEQRYQFLTGGPEVEMMDLEGPVVRQDGQFARLLESFADTPYAKPNLDWRSRYHPSNWFPAGGLPDDAVLVVKVEALDELRRKLGAVDHGETGHAEAVTSYPPGGHGGPGGRPMSASWPIWVAELVAVIHEQGVPLGDGVEGVDQLIAKVADQLAECGRDGPSRTTVQATVRSVLLRLRGAENSS
jgi:hypothetical protein